MISLRPYAKTIEEWSAEQTRKNHIRAGLQLELANVPPSQRKAREAELLKNPDALVARSMQHISDRHYRGLQNYMRVHPHRYWWDTHDFDVMFWIAVVSVIVLIFCLCNRH